MKKQTFHYLIIMLVVCFIASCSSPKDQTQESAETESQEKDTEKEISMVLNANLTSAQDLLTIEGVSADLADQIISGRPYLNMYTLDSILAGSFSEDEKNAVYSSLFVPLDLNTASEIEFKMIPGVGEKMAHEFEEYRPYVSIEQFRREIGKYVDDEEVARYENYVFVPVNLNKATDEEILSIPGVGDKMLHEFKEYRPYTSIAQFRREIGKYVDDSELDRLERFVTL